MTISLYIHIPFCTEKCLYCDFHSRALNCLTLSERRSTIKTVLDGILDELDKKLELIPEPYIKTVFIGGGTPSIIPPDLFARFLEKLNNRIMDFRYQTDFEFTTEANIESCSRDFLDVADSSGINRLSLGIQSFNPEILERIGRARFPEDIMGRISEIAAQWKKRLSFDIISGVTENYADDITAALTLSPDHISVYQLTVEQGTPLEQEVLSGFREAPDDILQTNALKHADAMLSSAGYKRYEISNYSKPGSECLHNLRYWNMQSYLGLGPSAVSSLYFPDKKIRLTNSTDHKEWNAGVFDTEELTTVDFMIEHFIMGCRLTEGIDRNQFIERFGFAPEHFVPRTLSGWSKRGLYNIDECALNNDGLLFLDTFLADLYEELMIFF